MEVVLVPSRGHLPYFAGDKQLKSLFSKCMAMICPDGALTKISVMFQKSALMVLSSSHINRDDSGGIK